MLHHFPGDFFIGRLDVGVCARKKTCRNKKNKSTGSRFIKQYWLVNLT